MPMARSAVANVVKLIPLEEASERGASSTKWEREVAGSLLVVCSVAATSKTVKRPPFRSNARLASCITRAIG
jgi:hypothetical protein